VKPPGGSNSRNQVPRKTQRLWLRATVPQTDTGRRVENTKVYERTLFKELGKQAAVTLG